MQDRVNRIFSHLFGDPRRELLEHRLLNTISLLNALANLGGALRFLNLERDGWLLLLHIVTGLLFLLVYYLSRFRGLYRSLYWPFVCLILTFLFLNSLLNAGSFGGAHYYFIPALVIATILAATSRVTMSALIIFGVVTLGLFLVEQRRPDWITHHASAKERAVDVATNFFFVQIFTGLLVMVLARNLNQERKKSDRLLLNILPERIAEELKANDQVEPLHYASASVLFTDFVGFTQIAETLTPQALIGELDLCFRAFDEIAKRHHLEKIKTIGDSYMAAGGIPAANRTHAVDAVLAALEIQSFMREWQQRKAAANQPGWQLRLGIHSGALVAGVIGREKFAYDVWGDTVNTASRMESSGAAERINISGATFEMVKDFFLCEPRGKIAAKNKGEIEMYFVERLRLEFSDDAEGRTPNAAFAEAYRRLA